MDRSSLKMDLLASGYTPVALRCCGFDASTASIMRKGMSCFNMTVQLHAVIGMCEPSHLTSISTMLAMRMQISHTPCPLSRTNHTQYVVCKW